jgi:hypothetical protein
MLVQQLSIPLPPGPQLVSPLPEAPWQLVPVVVSPVQPLALHIPVAHSERGVVHEVTLTLGSQI